MEQKPHGFHLKKRRPGPGEAERGILMEELARTQVLTNQAYACFNHADDSDLIESYVYEINALQARYNYLLRRLKALEVPS